MIYIGFGIFGFLLIHLTDPISLKKLPALKPALWLIGIGFLAFATIMVCLSPAKFTLPVFFTWFGWILLFIAFALLIFSLFISLPFRKTYLKTGVSNELITTGIYAIVRHPGIPSFVLLMISLVLISKSDLLLIVAPVFIAVDIILVIIQDKYYFVRMFSGYPEYCQQTPMLIPNKKSISSFFSYLKQGKILKETKGV